MSSQNLDDLTPSYIRDRALSKDEELNALVQRLKDHKHWGMTGEAATAITTLRAQLAEALEWKRYWSGEMDVVLAGRADETARADRAEAEISRLTDLNSTAYIDGHDAAKNEYRAEIQRLEVLNAQLTVMAGEDAVAAQIDVAGRAVKVIDDRIAAILADEESIMSPARQVISQWASSVIAELENIRAALARMKEASPRPIIWRDDQEAVVEDDEPMIGRDYE